MINGSMKNLKRENHTSKLASLYPYIKGLPGRGNLKGLTVTFTTLTIILASLVDWTITWVPALSYYSIIMINYLFSKVGRGLVNFRRLNGLTVIEMMINSVGLTIMHLFNLLTKPPIIGLALISSFTALSALLRGLVVRVLTEDDLSHSLRYSITVSALLVAPTFTPSLNNLLVPMLIGQITGNVLYIFYSSAINYFFRIHGLKPIKLLSAMLAIFLDGKKDSLENLAEKLNTRSDITIDCLVFREVGRRNVEIAFIIPTFHPGPFRDFGSSILPYLIEKKLSSKGVKTVFVRGLSDHSKNIISRKDCEFIAEEISNRIINYNSNYSRRIGLTKVLKYGSATASLIPVGDTTLIVLTLHPKGMEDIPPLLMDGIKRDDIIVVDAHNSFSEDVKELDGDGFRDIRNVLTIASETITERSSRILAGYSENMIEGYGLEDGIGPLGIRVLTFKNDNYFTALIVFDSNNAVPEIRERILKDAKDLGIDYCEVLTTDTHIVNGIKLGGRGYHPLGEVIPVEVVSSSVVQALKRAMLNLKEMEVSRVSTIFRNVKVMSNDFLAEAAGKTFKSLRLFYATILSTLITSGLTTLSLV